jgi:hypothetical protein
MKHFMTDLAKIYCIILVGLGLIKICVDYSTLNKVPFNALAVVIFSTILYILFKLLESTKHDK